MIEKNFITGVSHVNLADMTRGFNFKSNVSFHNALSRLCGINHKGVEDSLRQLPSSSVEREFSHLTAFVNGYRFCHYDRVEMAFNTTTCLE